MCEHVMREYMQEYNKRVRTTNKLGLRFEETNRFREPGTFGKRTRKEDPRHYPRFKIQMLLGNLRQTPPWMLQSGVQPWKLTM